MELSCQISFPCWWDKPNISIYWNIDSVSEMWHRDVSYVSDKSSPPPLTHLGAVSLWMESYLISPVSCSGHTPPPSVCVFKSSNIKVCCLRSLLILVSVHRLINHECFNCMLTLMKWMVVIYQLGVQWGDVGGKVSADRIIFHLVFGSVSLPLTPYTALLPNAPRTGNNFHLAVMMFLFYYYH